MLMGVLEFGSSTLTAHTFGGAGLLAWLTGAPAEVRPQPRPADPRAEQRSSLRAGDRCSRLPCELLQCLCHAAIQNCCMLVSTGHQCMHVMQPQCVTVIIIVVAAACGSGHRRWTRERAAF
jgi:hypothetical protein